MIIPYDPSHLARLDFTPEVAGIMADPKCATYLGEMAARALCATVCTEDQKELLGVVGVVPVSDGVGEVLFLATKTQVRYPLTFAKSIRAACKLIAPQFAIIQAIGEDTAFSRRFLEWFGLTCFGPIDRPEFKGKTMLMWRAAI